MSLKEVQLPARYNYIACFLTLECNLKCSYCINSFNSGNRHKKASACGKTWVEGLNRLVCPDNLPVTLQGGEPSLHPDFIWIIKNIKESLQIDILTNLSFNVEKFIKEVPPGRLRRKAPYPNIRVTYHPYYNDLDDLIGKVSVLQQAGFSIGIFGILHPEFSQEVLNAQKRCLDSGIDFRTKEFLGEFNGRVFGSYICPEAVGNINRKECLCRTSELIIGPDGGIYRCHHDLYKDFRAIGNLSTPDLTVADIYRQCGEFGDCNPCDMKIKTDRFQVYGHSSVEIKDIKIE